MSKKTEERSAQVHAEHQNSMYSEIERIEQFIRGEIPPPVGLVLTATPSGAPETTLNNVRDVMRQIVDNRVGAWPDDEMWRELFPEWFLETFDTESLTRPESLKRWDYSSWLDAMKTRGWVWWSSADASSKVLIYLCAVEWPYSTGALEYLVGVSQVKDHTLNEL